MNTIDPIIQQRIKQVIVNNDPVCSMGTENFRATRVALAEITAIKEQK